MDMIKGVTRSGFEFCVNRKAINNMRLIEALATSTSDNPLEYAKVVRMIFGEEQKERLYDHLQDEDGIVTIEAVSEAIADVFAAAGEAGKNS